MSGGSGTKDDGKDHIVLPEELRAVLPTDTARTWQVLASHLPTEVYLGGGTGVAAHLHHRASRDLDYFCHQDGFDIAGLEQTLSGLGEFAVTLRDKDILRGLFGGTKIEAFVVPSLRQLREPETIAGMKVASLEDLLAMKLKVMAERGEMRDYFDVMTIDERSPLTVEEGVELWIQRYRVDQNSILPQHLLLAMGSLEDVEEDGALPLTKAELVIWWRRRQAQVIRNSNRYR